MGRTRWFLVGAVAIACTLFGWRGDGRAIGREGRSSAAAAGMVRLAGDVLPVVSRSPGLLRSISPSAAKAGAQARALVPITLVLRRSDPAGFTRFLATVRDPGSSQYRHFLSEQQLTDRFGPSLTGYDAVLAWLRSQGLRDVRGSADRLTVSARGTRAQLERTFGVTLADFRLGGRDVYANTSDPAIPARLEPYVQSVFGLDDVGDPSRVSTPSAVAPAEQSVASGGGCNITIATLVQASNPCEKILADSCWDLLKAYAASAFGGEVIEDEKNFECAADELNLVNDYVASFGQRHPASRTRGARPTLAAPGTGQTIGLLEFDTFHPSDVSDFLALNGDSPAEINNVTAKPVDGGVPSPGAWEAEVLLDIDAAISLAPGAHITVYDAPQGPTGFVDEFNAMIADHVNVISNSWDTCEDLVTQGQAQAIDSVLQQAAAAGISVLNASGDEGGSCFGAPGVVAVPADSPNATAVGGSSMSGGPDGTYGGESWWDNSATSPPGGQGGFGVSRYFGPPSYQAGLVNGPGRSVPDVVANADPYEGYEICQADAGGCPNGGLFAGTSVATPILAALVADLQEQVNHPLAPLNPVLYAHPTAFHDAASMGSDFSHVGLGSPNFDQLALAIEGQQPGPVSGADSTLEALPAPGVPADGGTKDIIVAKLLDANGNTVPGKDVTLSAGPHAGNVQITPVGGTTSSANNGTVVFDVTDDTPETVTFTATDATDAVALPAVQVTFVSPPADGGGIGPATQSTPNDGTTTAAITVTLQTNGHGAPGKQVTLAPSPDTHSTILDTGPTPGVTDANGQVTFLVSDASAEQVSYSATDVTDGQLAVPGSASVTFANGGGNNEPCANSNAAPTALNGFTFTTFAAGFPNNRCSGPIGLAFDSSGNLYAGDNLNDAVYKFGPQGGAANATTELSQNGPAVTGNDAGLAFGPDGSLYMGENCGDVVQLRPSDGGVIRKVASQNSSTMPCPTGIAVDPLSGDLFATNVGSGTEITRIADPSSSSPTVSVYANVPSGADGISFAPDGTMYLAGENGTIYSITGTNGPATPAVTAVAQVPNNPDGIAVEAGSDGSAKALFVNTNGGNIWELSDLDSPSGPTQTLVFTNGSRGDFVTVGPDGCMYATQTDRILRLTGEDGSCPFAPTSRAPQINLVPVPQGSSGATGTTAAFEATLENVPNPSGTPITFTVSGANALNGPSSASVPTGNSQRSVSDAGADGAAAFSYIGRHTGADVVIARATVMVNGTPTEVTSPPVPFNWTQGPDVTALSLSASPAGGAVGMPTEFTVGLTDLSNQPATPISGASVQVSVQGRSCTVQATDAHGTGTCTLTPPGPAGLTTVNATYAGQPGTDTPANASEPFELLGGAPPVNVIAPAASGTAAVGQTLACSTGTWFDRPTPYTYAYQWNRDGSAINATSSTYQVTSGDAGHTLTCTVIASNGAGAGAPASSNAIAIPPAVLAPAGTVSPTVITPAVITAPAITGSPMPGSQLTCSTGTWAGGPLAYSYQWYRDGSPLGGSTGRTYTVQIADEAQELTCAVSASNAAGASAPARSLPVLVAIPGTLRCPRPSGRVRSTTLGPLHLGETRSLARKKLPHFNVTSNDFDNFCLYAGWGIRVGYPSPSLLAHVPSSRRSALRARIVLALTSNPFYALGGVRPGTPIATAIRRLHLGKTFHVGRNFWYFGPGSGASTVVKVRGGIVLEIGIASAPLTRGRKAQRRFITSFNNVPA